MLWWNIFVQALGFIGIFFMTISVQFTTHKKVMIFKTLGALMFATQYLFLKAYTGMILDFIGIGRNIIFTNNVIKKKSNKGWIIFFTIFSILAALLTTFFTWDSLVLKMQTWTSSQTLMIVLTVVLSLFSITAKSITTIAYGLSDLKKLRFLNFFSSLLWLFYNFTYFSISGFINEILVMSSIIIAVVRFKNLEKKKQILK